MNNLHEVETVTLRGNREWPRKELHEFLEELGFKSEDDFYHLKRNGSLLKWQTNTLATVDVFWRGRSIYETEDEVCEGTSGTWDSIEMKYYMASVPKECIQAFVTVACAIQEKFDLQFFFQGVRRNEEELLRDFEKTAAELTTYCDEPGSEALAILIQQRYSK